MHEMYKENIFKMYLKVGIYQILKKKQANFVIRTTNKNITNNFTLITRHFSIFLFMPTIYLLNV